MQELYVSLLVLITPSSLGGVGLSDNQISFSTNTVNGWQGLSGGSRAAVAVGENKPLKMESSLGHALYLHPIEQSGTYIYNSKDELITRSGAPLPNDGNLLRAVHSDAGTRGAKYTDASLTNAFGVSAVLTKTTDHTSSSYFQNLKATPNGGSWVTSEAKYWPTDGSLSFYAYYPYCTDSHSMLSEDTNGDVNKTKTVHYVAATSADGIIQQPDLIVAKHENVTHGSKDAPTSVGLTFSHVLTAITFAVGSDMVPGTVKSIAIKGVKNTGDYDLATGKWTTSGNDADFTINLGGGNGTKVNGTQDVALTSGNQTLMMIPQTFDANSGAKVEIVFNKDGQDRTLTAPLRGIQWEAGSTIIYKVSTSSLLPTLTLNKVTFPTDWSNQYTKGALKSDYVQGDKMGLYVVDQTGVVKEANVMLTYNGNAWSLPAGKNIRMNSMNSYFTYYPYQANPQGMPVQNGTVQPNDLASANAFFKSLEDAWTLKANQSNKDDLNAGDLQVAKAVVDNTGSGINITMAHAMGLADITLGPGIKCALKNDQTYTFGSWLVSDQFKTNIPYKLFCNHYIAIVKPTKETVFSADADANALKYSWKKSLSFKPSVAEIQKQTAVMADETVHLYELQAGDVYYSTGAISHQTEVLEPECYTPIGIVVYIASGKGNDDYWVEKDTKQKGIGGHALVMCRKEVNSTGWQSHVQGIFGPVTDYHREKVNTAKKIKESGNKPYGSGYLETEAYVGMGAQMIAANKAKNYKEYSAPLDKSTGWFLPSAGQICSMCYQFDPNFDQVQWEINNEYTAPHAFGAIDRKIDGLLKKIGTDNTEFLLNAGVAYSCITSSEYDGSYMLTVLTTLPWNGAPDFFFLAGRGVTKGATHFNVRPFLAF